MGRNETATACGNDEQIRKGEISDSSSPPVVLGLKSTAERLRENTKIARMPWAPIMSENAGKGAIQGDCAKADAAVSNTRIPPVRMVALIQLVHEIPFGELQG